jgi:NAD(P)-dependent dehydrogenase (short-subunit alcohol dehydrogenase family)
MTTSATLSPAATSAQTLTGRVALVTGGVRGIGLAISRDFLERGATVAAGYSRNEEAVSPAEADDPEHVSVHRATSRATPIASAGSKR